MNTHGFRRLAGSMRHKAQGVSPDADAQDVTESFRRLNDPREERIPWDQVKKRAGLYKRTK